MGSCFRVTSVLRGCLLLNLILALISISTTDDDANLTMNLDDLLRAGDSWADRLGISLPGQLFQMPFQSCGKPPRFPETIPIRQTDYINWAEIIKLPRAWTAVPTSAQDVVTIVNWAFNYNHTIRARGFMHSWAPITLTSPATCSKTVLVDTTKHLKKMELFETKSRASAQYLTTVSVQTGASWEELLTFLESKGYGVFSFPAVGQMSIGGTFAVGAHGTGRPTKSSRISKGFRTGSISNLITSLDAVVWDPTIQAYAIKTFYREEEDTRAFMVHLGRAFITRISMMVDKNYNLRCQSITNIKAEVLFGPDGQHEKALANYVENYDRVEAQFFPYTDKTWLKLWTNEETKRFNSVSITKPYPYTHGNPVARPVDRLIALLASGLTRLTPIISRMTYELGVSGVQLTRTADVWGPSKNSLLYYHHLAHKFISLGYTVLTTRANVQRVAHSCHTFFTSLSNDLSRNQGKYPMNQPVEFRITGLDNTERITLPDNTTFDLKPPALSFLSEVDGHPEYDIAVFLGLHYFPRTPNAAQFMRDWESFLFSTFSGEIGTARVEWAKTWGFDSNNPWVNETVYRDILPKTFGKDWNWAIDKLNQYDPHNIYSNDFLKKFMKTI